MKTSGDIDNQRRFLHWVRSNSPGERVSSPAGLASGARWQRAHDCQLVRWSQFLNSQEAGDPASVTR